MKHIINFKNYINNYDHSKNDLHKIIQYSEKLITVISPCTELEDWVKAKITHAEDYINIVLDYIKFYKLEDEYKEDYKIPNKMAIGDLKSINHKAKEIFELIDNVKDLKDWVKSKLNLAGEYLDDVYHHLDYKNNKAKI